MDPAEARAGLIHVLQHAYSGEKAAAYAYRGHWQSVADPDEAARIREIEAEEWHHRDLVGGLLRELGAGPRRGREIRAALIGRTLGALCHLSGWFLPMYGAGKLESRNIVEYEDAAPVAPRVQGLAGAAAQGLHPRRREWILRLLQPATAAREAEFTSA